MDQYITGNTIKMLREKHNLTQLQLAEKLCVSDKTVSKWETGRGYPDISFLKPLADVFSVSISELLLGNTISNTNVSANMMKSKFYVCPICGNVIHSLGEAAISCHGILLSPLEAEEADDKHKLSVEISEDEYYVTIDHEMSKQHYISFIAAVSSDKIQMVKLYPEGFASARFKINGVRRFFFFCNHDGLFTMKL